MRVATYFNIEAGSGDETVHDLALRYYPLHALAVQAEVELDSDVDPTWLLGLRLEFNRLFRS